MSLKFAVLVFVFLVFLMPDPAHAKRVYFSSDGTPMTDPASSSGDTAGSGGSIKTMTTSEKMARDAAAAAAAGYALGQTVKVENGIIYKLARDPKSKAYTFKLYRRVTKKPALVKTKPPEKIAPPESEADKEKKAASDREKERQAVIAAETAREKAREREKAQKELARRAQEEREKQAELKAQAQAREEQDRIREMTRKARMEAEKEAIRKAEADARADQEGRKRKRADGTAKPLGRRLGSGHLAVTAEHSFLNRKTVLKSRSVTTATGTVNDTNGVGDNDVFYTDIHSDMLKIRYGITRRLELSLEAGMVFEQLDEIGDMEPAYGAGFRAPIIQIPLAPDWALYLDGSARYYTGKVTGRFSDPYGDTYDKSSEFQEMEAGLEAGITVSRLTLFSGLTYAMYTEDTVRTQISSPPDVTILDDRLEEQESLVFKAGAEYRVLPALLVYIEGQALYREGLVAGIEYRF